MKNSTKRTTKACLVGNPMSKKTVRSLDHQFAPFKSNSDELQIYELESMHPHCVLPPFFFERALAKMRAEMQQGDYSGE